MTFPTFMFTTLYVKCKLKILSYRYLHHCRRHKDGFTLTLAPNRKSQTNKG